MLLFSFRYCGSSSGLDVRRNTFLTPLIIPSPFPPFLLSPAATTYFSMLFLSDYIFSFNNFLGVTISVVGSLLYSYIELAKYRGGKPTKNDDSSSSSSEKTVGKAAGAGNRHRPQGKR